MTDAVVRSQSGRIIANTLTDDAVTESSTYLFDAAGRLKIAEIPRHKLTYGYAGAACGSVSAGKNGNRTYYAAKTAGRAAKVDGGRRRHSRV